MIVWELEMVPSMGITPIFSLNEKLPQEITRSLALKSSEQLLQEIEKTKKTSEGLEA